MTVTVTFPEAELQRTPSATRGNPEFLEVIVGAVTT